MNKTTRNYTAEVYKCVKLYNPNDDLEEHNFKYKLATRMINIINRCLIESKKTDADTIYIHQEIAQDVESGKKISFACIFIKVGSRFELVTTSDGDGIELYFK